MHKLDELKLKVEAVNSANAYANQIRPLLMEVCKAFIGKKVTKADGSLAKAFKDALPQFTNTHKLRVWNSGSHYTLSWVVNSSASNGGSCVYHETYLYVAELDGQTLKSVIESDTKFKEDYLTSDILAKRQEYERLKKLADNAKSELHPFGE